MVFDRFFARDGSAGSSDGERDESSDAQKGGTGAITDSYPPKDASGRQSGQQAISSPPESDEASSSRLGTVYDILEENCVAVGGQSVITETAGEGPVAGPAVRDMFEAGLDTTRPPLWIGYDVDAHRGFREAPLPFDSLFRHLWVTGTTGYGKTTELLNMMVQWAYAGYGFVYVDPKARDSRELLRMLPEHRLDDVVWIEPGSPKYDKTIGLNFLELPDHRTAEERENQIENRVENLKAIFDTDEYWGVNMESITESMARAMMQSEKPFSVIDMYFTLLNAERRKAFAQDVDDPYVREFCLEIAQMDDETIRPLLKRIKSWVENAVVRRIIAHRESTVDFRDIVANDRIVIVSTPVENPDIKKMVTLGVLRNLWSAIQHRSHEETSEPDPYFVLCDEFDEIASENLDIESMLARARSMRLSVTLASQYPSQFDDDTLKAMQNNCDTLLAFSVNDVDDARLLMKRFQGYSAEDLISTDQYEAWTKLPLGGGRYSDPVRIRSFPPYPPLRSADAVEVVVERSLDRYGTEKLSDGEILRNLLYSDSNDAANPAKLLAERMADAIRAVQLREGVRAENGWVEAAVVDEELATRLDRADEDQPEIEYEPAELPDVRETSRLIEVDLDVEGDTVVTRLTEDGEAAVKPETGTVQSAGGSEHDALLADAERVLTEHGFSVSVVEQDGRSQPDAMATHSAVDTPFAIEAETTTPERPAKVLQNLARAQKADRIPLFVVRPGDPTTAHASRVENICSPPLRELSDGTEQFYNCDAVMAFGGGATTRGGVTAVRPHSGESNRTVWRRAGGEYILSDGSTEFVRIDSRPPFSKDRLPATYSYDREAEQYTVYTAGDTHQYDSKSAFDADWIPVKRPFIPTVELPADGVPRDSYLVLILPEDGAPSLFQDGTEFQVDECLERGELWPSGEPATSESPEGDGPSTGAPSDAPGAEQATVSEAPSLEPDADAVEAFTAMYVTESTGGRIAEDRLFEAYLSWIDQHDIDGTTDKGWFTRKLRNAAEFDVDRLRDDGDRVRYYTGLELTADGETLLDE